MRFIILSLLLLSTVLHLKTIVIVEKIINNEAAQLDLNIEMKILKCV